MHDWMAWRTVGFSKQWKDNGTFRSLGTRLDDMENSEMMRIGEENIGEVNHTGQLDATNLFFFRNSRSVLKILHDESTWYSLAAPCLPTLWRIKITSG
jgi:hypothetical protein